MKVKFKVLELVDARKQGSDLEVDGVYTGEQTISGSVWYRDMAGDNWVFYPGISCEIVNDQPEKSNESGI